MIKKIKTLFAVLSLVFVGGLTACTTPSEPTTSSEPEISEPSTPETPSEPETPVEPEVTLVSIEATPVTTEFTVGDEFIFDGTVIATYSDETTADVTTDATFSGYYMTVPGLQEVTVTYEGVVDYYDITVLEPVLEYGAESILVEIMKTLTGAVPVKGQHYGEEDGMFYTSINFGDYGEEYLEVAVTTVISALPEYCVEYSAPTAGTWSNGAAGVFATYVTEDLSVAIELGSMINAGKLYCQITTYAISA